eukprot:11071824-Alexandrium_andersonii.AAC.1
MSASLVGSEMCIRDRFILARWHPGFRVSTTCPKKRSALRILRQRRCAVAVPSIPSSSSSQVHAEPGPLLDPRVCGR